MLCIACIPIATAFRFGPVLSSLYHRWNQTPVKSVYTNRNKILALGPQQCTQIEYWPWLACLKCQVVDLPIKMKGISKHSSGKSLSPLKAQNKDIGAASQTLQIEVQYLCLQCRLVLSCQKNSRQDCNRLKLAHAQNNLLQVSSNHSD